MTERHNRLQAGNQLYHQGGLDDGTWAFDAFNTASLDASSFSLNSGTPVISPGAAGPSQVVFIDSRTPDIADLISGALPGEQIFVLDPTQDGLDQIASILKANDLSGLSAISIVGHGASGEIDLGSAVIDDANLGHDAAALSVIGASLAPGGDLALYACDTAAGAVGHQFIADLSAYAGGVDVAAATHLVGSTDLGGSWTLDASTEPATTAPAPFTASALADYNGVLGTQPGRIFLTTSNTEVISIDVNGSAGAPNATTLASAATTSNFHLSLYGIAIDTASGKYFVVDEAALSGTSSTILAGNISGGGGAVTPIYTSAVGAGIYGMRFDPQNSKLYFAQVDSGWPSVTTATGIYTINEDGTLPTKLVSFTGADSATTFAIDTADNLLFFTNGGFNTNPVESVEVANLTTGSIISTNLFSIDPTTSQLVGGIDVDPANHRIYWTTSDPQVSGNNEVFSATFITGASVTLSNIAPIYTGSVTSQPFDVSIDVADGIFYTATTDGTNFKLVEGNLNGTGSPATVYSASGYNPVFESLELTPTLTLTLSSTAPPALKGGPAVSLVSAATVVDSAQDIASATVSITGNLASGDTLSFESGAPHFTFGDGHTISASFSNGVLSLTGDASAADYQSALYTVAFSTTSSNAADRTVSWSVSDGNLSSATSTSTVHVLTAPVVAGEGHTSSSGSHIDAGKTVTFTVAFSSAVNVTTGANGAPTLQLNGSEVATYLSGSGTNTLTFSYTVQPGDTVTDLKATSFVALPTGTTIKDGFGQDADLSGFTAIDTGVQVDTTAPGVTSVSVTANGTYIAGQNLDFTVNLSEAVTVTGTPEIALTLDTGTVDAVYVSGSGTSTLTFQHLVAGGEADTSGITMGSSILLNGGTVQDAAANAATLTLTGVGSTSGVLVDAIPPTVASVSVPTDGVYSFGQALAFTVHFSENVLVTTGGGSPYIDVTLDTGGTGRAVYTGGCGTPDLTFSYTIAVGNDDANGIAVGSSINLNGGTIKDAATNAAVLTLNSVGSTTGVLVDAVLPTVSSIHTVDSSTNNLDTEHFTVTFSAPVNGVDASDFTLVGTGTVNGAITSVSGSGTTWNVTVGNVTGDGTLRLDLNNSGDPITDTYGNTLTAAHTGDQSYTIEHTPPSVTAMTVPADGTHVAGDHLDFTTTFSEVVTVTGTPRIALTLDTGGTVYATYVSGSGTNALTFQYTVAPGNQDLTGIVTGTAIDLNGGTIKDAATNDAALAINAVEPSTAGIDIDAVIPVVSSVGVPSNGTYATGNDLDFTVNFTKVVTVNTVGGVPHVEVTLDTGGTVDATYISGSGTSALVFRYVVASGELDSNGVTLGSTLVLNGATIQDPIGNNAAQTLNNVGSTTGVLVDSILPTVTSIDTVDASTNNLHTEHFTVTFSTDVSLNPPDTTDFTLHATGTVGGTISSVTAVSGNTYIVTVTGVNGDGTLRLDLNTSGSTITDAYGNPVTSAHTGDQSYTIDHTAPAAPTLALAHDTGASNTDNITSDPSIIYSTPVAGDTLLYKVDGGSYSATVPVFATDHSADGSHTVSVEEVDAAGNVSTAASLSFTLDTTAPAAPTLALTHDTGVSNTDNITSDPSITYALSAAGDTLLYKVDGGNYSATAPVFPTDHSADGSHTVSVEEVDAAGNVSTAASLSFTLDTTPPAVVSVTADHTMLLAGQTALVTFAFSEAVSGFVFGDTTVSGGSLSNLVHVGINGSNQDVYTATFTPDATNTEAGSVQVNAASYSDIAGNNNGLASSTVTFSGDTLAPTAVATASPSSGTEVIGDLLQITLSFGEAVTITGSTPGLALNDGGTAIYDAAATAALNDASKLVFDYTVAASDANTSPLAITGVAHGTTITDLAFNAAGVAATFTGLGVVTSLVTANPDTNHAVASQTVTADAAHGVLANDADTSPADHVVVSAVDGLAADVNQPVAGQYGSLTLHADGSYSYTASSAVTGEGTDTFTYTASNGHGPDSTSTLTIAVSGANQNYIEVPSGGSGTGGYNNTVLDGSAGGATLTAAATFNAHQILVGGPGDILNAASFGQDTFVFADNFGHETINNFHPALDVIQLQQSQFGSLAAVMADIQQVGADSVLTLDANHVITITNTPHTSLTASDFHLV